VLDVRARRGRLRRRARAGGAQGRPARGQGVRLLDERADADRAGGAVPAVGRPEPAPHLAAVREDGRLRPAGPPRPVHLRLRRARVPQARVRRRSEEVQELRGALRRRRVPGRHADDRGLAARARQVGAQDEDAGRSPGAVELGGGDGVRFDDELAVAAELARRAGALVLRYFGTGVEVEAKAGNEPVTRADREASELILAGLRARLPDDVLISEEAPDDPRRLDARHRVWFIDPLDGTRDFIRGRAGFSVMIGLIVEGRPQLGAVYQPQGDRLYLAAPGRGSTLVDERGERPLHCSAGARPGRIRLVASRSHRTPEIDRVKQLLGIEDEMNIGSVGLKLGLIALGERDLYVNPSSRSSAWDTCAPEALLAHAGGRITDLAGAPLRYDLPDMK